ncbi:MAG: hypothetical protein K0Q71_1596, partial [Thermomicrobiales bacterium]|nr:hypothetical protein [Thermomicrobiales bacterium]
MRIPDQTGNNPSTLNSSALRMEAPA